MFFSCSFAYQALQARERIELKNEVEPTVENIAKEMNIPLKEVVYALDAISDTVSLFDPVYHDGGDTIMLMDQISDAKNTDENWTEEVALRTAIGELSEREKQILYLRYYDGRTQMEISDEVGISQAQVSRLEKNALSQMKTRI